MAIFLVMLHIAKHVLVKKKVVFKEFSPSPDATTLFRFVY